MSNFFVEIIEDATSKVIKRMGPFKKKRMAEKTEDGVNINLDHGRFSTRIVGV